MRTGEVSQQEKDAARNSGQLNREEFDKESPQNQAADTIGVEEMAVLYVQLGGTDKRALAVVEAARAAGRVDNDGDWIGEGGPDAPLSEAIGREAALED